MRGSHQIGMYSSNYSSRRTGGGGHESVESMHEASAEGATVANKQLEVGGSDYVTPRTEYVSPAPEILSLGENYSFQPPHSPARDVGADPEFFGLKASTPIPEVSFACRMYGAVGTGGFGAPLGRIEAGAPPPPPPLIPTLEEEFKSPSVPRVPGQGPPHSGITRSERIYTEYQAATRKNVCSYNLGEPSPVAEIPEDCGLGPSMDTFRPGVGLVLPHQGLTRPIRPRTESVPEDYQYNMSYGVFSSEHACVVPSEGSSSSYLYSGLTLSREGGGGGPCQPAIAEYVEFNAPPGNYVDGGAGIPRLNAESVRDGAYFVRGGEVYGQSLSDCTGGPYGYYPAYASSAALPLAPPGAVYPSPVHQTLQADAFREAEMRPEYGSHYRTKQIGEVYDRIGLQSTSSVRGGMVPGVCGLPTPPAFAAPPHGLTMPPNIPVLSGMNEFQDLYVPHSLQEYAARPVEVGDGTENGEDHCSRKRRRPGTAGSDRNFYIVDFVCEIPVNIKDLFMNVLKEYADGPRILSEFSLGSLAMRRSGNLVPAVIKCFFHSYRDGISRLQCKSKRHEGRPFLFVINETKLSRPWVLCPNVKCIKRAKSSGKLKGRIKVYEYCPGSNKIVLSQTFLKCARGFLTSDYYFCATLCPQQKYADHDSSFWGEDFATGFGGDRIQETLAGNTNSGGNGVALADYILFCNSKHQFVATFRRFPAGARPRAPPVKNSSYVNASSPDGIFGDEAELKLVNIMTSVIRTLEGSNEPTVYTSTDKFAQEVVSLSSAGGATLAQNSGFNRQNMQPISSREASSSFGHSSRADTVPIGPEEAGLAGGAPESVLGIVEISVPDKWSEDQSLSSSGTTHGFQQHSDLLGESGSGQHMFVPGDFADSAKDERSGVYAQSLSLDIEDPFSSKLETYSTGYTDEDSFSTFNDTGAQISLNFDPQDALVVESSTNWVLDVLLNKSSEGQSYSNTPVQNSQTPGPHHPDSSYSADLTDFDRPFYVNPKSQSSSVTRSPGNNPGILENDGFDHENENIPGGNDNNSY